MNVLPTPHLPRSDCTFYKDEHGAIFIKGLHTIRSVGIADLAQVQSHHINRIMGSVSHVVHLRGGGIVRFAYNQRGEVIELSGERVKVTISPDNACRFSAID